MNEPIVVAEIGSTWKRTTEAASWQACLESIKAAAKCGAGAVKFQLFKAEKLYRRKDAPQQWLAAKQNELPVDWLPGLRDACASAGVEFWLSVFDPDSAGAAAPYVDCLKLASGEITGAMNKPLLQAAVRAAVDTGCPVALSTGGTFANEIGQAVEMLQDTYLILFNCVSLYPANPDDYNLHMFPYRDRAQEFGISDHTPGNDLVGSGVMLGYTYFEKHFALPDTPDCGDMKVALRPIEFERYCQEVRESFQFYYRSNRMLTQEELQERVWMGRGPDGLRPALVKERVVRVAA